MGPIHGSRGGRPPDCVGMITTMVAWGITIFPKRYTQDSSSSHRAVCVPNDLALLGLEQGNNTGTGNMPANLTAMLS